MKTKPNPIDRSSFEPAYLQLVRVLREQIAAGQFRPGDRLPSESQLCRRYQVSPMTVRRAINLLLEQGVVTTERGRGTFVKPLELGGVSFSLDRFQDLLTDRDGARIQLLDVRIVEADERVAAELDLPVGDRVIHMQRLFHKNGEPLIYHAHHLIYDPKRPVVEAEMEVTSLYGLLSGSGTSLVKWGRLGVHAAVLDASQARLLRRSEGAPAFYLEHTFYDYEDRPVSWGGFTCPGDCFHFTATVGVVEGCEPSRAAPGRI
ncbi:transcriptional regulator, GntR family [Desulfacinum infernum DSM 9756]|uniref:Transcriptional regulator, GntR family n=1 Tax=Desulfacinum infernum DSM 9756 TaxID=1121391 RepID=A0A1M4Z3H0_9BACT|nr:GntR family transcriptional regulator [Desulfacinum infernum]SHF12560.1 transcriptional regulator, GntR family [Desulfacinum infernum DSM 9756]